MELPTHSLRLRVYVGESDSLAHRPLYEAIVMKAREEGLAGATVFRSPMGFGANSRIHTAKVLNLSTDLPVVVEIIDAEDRVRGFLETLRPLMQGGMVTVEPVEVIHYSHAR